MDIDSHLKEITCQQAMQMIGDDPRTLLVDVRSSMEFLFVGHPQGSVHIPWIDEPDWDINPNFVADIRKLLLGGISCTSTDSCVAVFLICRSGKRSYEAGKSLVEAGFKQVYSVDEGFEGELNEDHQRSTLGGWRFHGCPWEQC